MEQEFIIVEKLDNPLRIDKYLLKVFPGFSRRRIAFLIKEAKIKIIEIRNKKGKKIKPSFLLKGGEKIKIGKECFQKQDEKSVLEPVFVPIEPEIIYEDKNLLAINKPAHLIVHPTEKNIKEPAVAGWLIKKYPALKNVGEDPLRPGIIHRLDKETSGVMVIAKNQETFDYLKKLFASRKIRKKYLALVRGSVKKEKGKIDFSLTYSKKSSFKRKIVDKEDITKKAKTALTEYKVLKKYNGYTLLEVLPLTGRTHQVRTHLAAIGFPVAGDKIYGRQRKEDLRKFPRLFLHSREISFFAPTGEFLTIEAALSDDLKDILDRFS